MVVQKYMANKMVEAQERKAVWKILNAIAKKRPHVLSRFRH